MRRIRAIVSGFALLMSLAGMATAATASTYDWEGNGYPNASCDEGSTTALWVWTGDDPSSLTINGHEQVGSWTQSGQGSWHWTITIDGDNFPPVTASITYAGTIGTLTLSGCDEGGAQPTPTPTPAPTAAATATPAPTAAPTATPTAAPTATPVGGVLPTETNQPSGQVEGLTGTPGVTLPATDTLRSTEPGPSIDGWRTVLIGLAAAMLISALAFTESRRSSRRR